MHNDKIRALDDREKAREKLPIFYGSRDNYLHGFKEVLNNAVDEVLNNFDSGIVDVILHKDLETITIKDSGRGMPIADKNENGIPYYELIFTTLFAGGKYEETNANNTGTNGVGTCILNFTSEVFNIEVCNNGKKYIIEYENGGYIKTPLTYMEDTDEHGTQITFKLDKSIYTKTKYSYQEIRDIIDKTAKVSNEITLTLTYETKEIFHYDSLEEYFNMHTSNNLIESLIGQNKLYKEADDEKTQVELVLSCSNEENLLQECMLNGNNLIEKSSIFDGVLDGLRTFINKYLKENGLYIKKEKPISKDDIENSVNFCCNVLSNRVEFQSQTKFSTAKKLYKTIIQQYVQELLEIYSIEKRDDFIKLANQILICKRAYEKAEIGRKEAKKKLAQEMNVISRPEKFVPCRSKDKTKRELILIEGDSSLNSVKLSRDSEFQCIYPLKGKPINALKKNIDKLLKNQEITDIFQILNCGMIYNEKPIKGIKKFNIDDLDINHIVVFTDEDDDGMHIRSLIIGIFAMLAPMIIEKGHLYILDSPLYRLDTKDKTYLAYDDKEKNNIVKELKNTNIPFTESRFKGLGGLSVDLLSETAMNIENRKLTQITMNDIAKAKQYLEMFLDDDSTDRKIYIEKNGEQYFDYSIYEI
jgi:DNA gyrase subunit B